MQNSPLRRKISTVPASVHRRLEHHAVVMCTEDAIGPVIGRGGKTVRALEKFTSCRIYVNDLDDCVRIDIFSRHPADLHVATSMVQDIVDERFYGFDVLYEAAFSEGTRLRPEYIPGQGLVVGYAPSSSPVTNSPRSVVGNSDDDDPPVYFATSKQPTRLCHDDLTDLLKQLFV